MGRTASGIARATLCVLTVIGAPTLLAAQEHLFSAPSPEASTAATLTEPYGLDATTTLRHRVVSVSFDRLASGPVSDGSDVAPTITLNLFPDEVVTAELDELTTTPGGYAWIGHADKPDSSVVLAVRGGLLAGNISFDGKTFQVRPGPNGTHTVSEVDLSQLPDELEPFPVDFPEVDLDLPLGAQLDDGTRIDVLVAYTPAARAGAGGTSQIQTLIDLAVAETNSSYANSGIQQRIQLVHSAELSYIESGNIGTDLNALTSKVDGQMDSVHGLRDAYLADEVVLLVQNGGGYCGIAWLMGTVSSSFESNAFSVVATSCATGYYSFGHELGHNMGARHDRYVDSTNGSPYAFNHGYVDTTNRWRTVMAYNSECAASSFNCTRLPYWSNPDVTYSGAPMGVPDGQAGAADNRKTLNATAFTVANFRQSGVSDPILDVSLSGSGSGTVTSAPSGINCGIDCAEAYGGGETVTLTAAPSSGSTFAGWSGACTGTGTCVVTMTQNRSVTASFQLLSPPTIVIAAPNNNETWTGGTTHTVSWTPDNLSSGARIYLFYYDGGWQPIADFPSSTLSYDWSVPAVALTSSTLFVGSYASGAWETYDTKPFNIAPPSDDTSYFYTVNPCRLVDTRDAGFSPALSAGVARKFPVTGNCGIPAGAKAISVNVAVTGPTAAGNVRVYAGDASVPEVSTINYVASQTRSNNAVVSLNGAGEVAALASQSAGTVHFILDVNGYFK